jgi:hypothetical protein
MPMHNLGRIGYQVGPFSLGGQSAVEKEMAIIGMKIPSRGLLLSSWTPPDDPDARHYGTKPGHFR